MIYPRLLQKHNKRRSARTAKCRADLPSRWRPLQPTNHRKAFRALIQSERSEHAVGGSRAAPKRDIEIVEERRLVGHECHSLRVLIIWRGVCSARPVRLPGGNPGGAETKLNRDDWWTHFRTGEIPSRLPVGPHYRLRRKEIDRVWARGIGRFASTVTNLTTSAGSEMILLSYKNNSQRWDDVSDIYAKIKDVSVVSEHAVPKTDSCHLFWQDFWLIVVNISGSLMDVIVLWNSF